MTDYHFETHRPVNLYVELGKGSLRVIATETTESHVEITGRDADDVHVDLSGDQLTIVAPKMRTGFLMGDSRIDATVTIPQGSDLTVKTGSADIAVEGPIGAAKVRSGSGDVQADAFGGPAVVETGSGNIRIDDVRGELRIKSGSGDIALGHAEATVVISTGSGDVEIASTNGPTVVKTGSGDLKVDESRSDVSLTTGSGDLVIGAANRGRLSAKGASGDVRVGIPAGVPVWTDVSTVSGEIHSNLAGAGEPKDGADHVELRAKTVSGDIVLTQV